MYSDRASRTRSSSGPLPGFRLLLLLTALMTTALQAVPPATQLVPADAIAVLEVTDPEPLFELVAGQPMSETVTALPLYQQQATQPQFQEFLNVVRYLETALDTDWRSGLKNLIAGGLTLALCPEETVVLIADAEDERLLAKLHEILLTFARSEAEKEGQPERVVSTQYRDITAWTFGGDEAHAIVGKRFVFSNRPEGLKAVLERSTGNRAAALASNSRYQAASQTAGANDVTRLYVNLPPLMRLPGLVGAFEQSRANPLAALVFAGVTEAVQDAGWLAARLSVDRDALTLRTTVDGRAVSPTNPAAFAWPQTSRDGAFPNLSVPGRIAALSFYRDLYQFYSAKDELFPERTSGLIFFENMMGIFFSGRDLTNEVLAEAQPDIRLVVAAQEFDPAIGTPRVQLPALAVVLRLRHAGQFDEVVEEAWQKALGLINFTRGQQALQGLIIDRFHQGQTKFTMAYFSTSGIQDKSALDLRFNLRPALAMPGDYVILSSTDALARDVIDALSHEGRQETKPLSEVHSLVEVDGRHLAAILKANREILIQGDMVKKGNTREQSESGIDLLLTLADLVDNLRLSLGAHRNVSEAVLRLKLNLPSP